MLERDVDRGIVEWAKDRWPGMIIRKLSMLRGQGRAGDPDRLFVWRGKLLLIEMKSSDGECTDLQLEMHNRWRNAGATVIVVSDVSAGRAALLQTFDGRRRQFSAI
jgi:hypothetical protein